MERLLARLERKLGRYAIHNFTTYIVGAMAFAFAIGMFRPDLLGQMYFDPHLFARQPWRLVTWLAMPPSMSIFWIFFALMFQYFIGNTLEGNWGAFKYNVYYFVGALAAIAASVATGKPTTNIYLNESLLFAVATLAPDFEIQFFFFPIKLKWIGLVGLVYVGFQFINGDAGDRFAIGASFLNYFVFFGGHLVGLARGRRMAVRQAARRQSFRPPPVERAAAPTGRVCAICGARQDDGADIRVCNCEKCGGKARELCLEHARNH
jgi:membrane associated rhomboid family serine protease